MADPSVEKKSLAALQVVQLKSELERRNLDTAGTKAVLLERLAMVLKEEGHDPETDLLEVPIIGPESGDGFQDAEAPEEDTNEMGGQEEPRDLDDSDKINQVEEGRQDAEIVNEVAEDAMIEDEDMVDEEHLLALEEDGVQPQDEDQDPGEAADGDQEEDGNMQISAEDFTDMDVLREDEEMDSGAREHQEHEESVTEKTSEDSAESGTNKGTDQKGEGPAAAAASATASGASASPSTDSAAGAKPATVKSSSPAVKKPAASPKSVAGGSKPSGVPAKPAGTSTSAADSKPTTAVRPKVAVKSGSSSKPVTTVQKSGTTPSRTDSAPKQTVTKPTSGQKPATSTTKTSVQTTKTTGLKSANVSAVSPSGDKGDSKGKDASAVQAGEDSFDVQVDDTVLKEIDADLLDGEQQTTAACGQVEAAAEDQDADKGASGPQQVEPTAATDGGDSSIPEPPPEAAPEEETAGASKEQDSAQNDDKKPEEKKDEKDTKAVKSGSAQAAAKPKGKDDKGTANSRNLWVSGLSSSTRATDLKNLFGKYGKVVGAKVVTNARSPGWRCYGFVTMASADETTKCIQHLHRTELHGKMISVERFSSFKAKTGAPVKTSASSKTITGRSITGKPTPVTITTKNIAMKKDDKKTPAARKEGGKEGDKKVVKKDVQKEGSKDAKKEDQASKEKPEDKKTDKPQKKDEKDGRRSHQSSRDRSRHRESEKSREQRERDILSFEKIRAERERERLRQKELQLRCEERYRLAELDRERQHQKMISRKQRDEAMELEREKEKLRMEKERLEFERQEAERLRRETSRLKRIAEEKLRREQERLEEERRAIKRPAPPPKVNVGDYWGEAAKQSRKDAGFKSLRDRDFRREERREERGGHRDIREEFSGNGPVPGRGHGSRDSRKVSGGHHSWGNAGDSHSKVDSGWGRGPEGNGSGDRWMGSSSIGSQHQRTGSSGFSSHSHGSHGGHGSRGISSSGGGNMYMSSGPSHSMSGSGMSRQQDARFNIAAITARRF